LSEVERRLLALGVFSRVTASVSDDDPATVTVTVEEGPRLTAHYEVSYQEKEGIDEVVRGKGRVDVDADVHNLFGRGLRLGARFGQGVDLQDVSVDTNLPALWRQDLTLSLSSQVDRLALNPLDPQSSKNTRRQRGVQLRGQTDLAPRWTLQYGYRFRHNELEGELLDVRFDVGGLDAAVLNDTRDNVLDPRRGRFLSLAVEYAPTWGGLDFTFVKGLGKAALAHPLGGGLTWAHSYQLGLAHGFRGQRLIFTERFNAGGGNSVRGFGKDRLGPLSPPLPDGTRQPLGGQSVIVINQELRYHHQRSGLGGVVFYDAGNVFALRPSLDLRHALGFGLCWESPVGPLRLDLGFPLRPRADRDEKSPQLHFSIGQAF
jgi:outer membrane protein assembly factor BamA